MVEDEVEGRNEEGNLGFLEVWDFGFLKSAMLL